MNARVGRLDATVARRLLVNFRADPEVVRRMLPEPFAPQVVDGVAMVGMCLIRLEHARPASTPRLLGLSSEHVAHRVAVVNRHGADVAGVYIPRRDTDSRLAVMASRRFFSAAVHRADFSVQDDGAHLRISVASRDGVVGIDVGGFAQGSALPSGSVFDSVEQASQFFRRGSVGYSNGARAGQYDGVRLELPTWSVRPFDVRKVRSSFFENRAVFPPGSIEFDNALLMRHLDSTWEALTSTLNAPARAGRSDAASPRAIPAQDGSPSGAPAA
jgi:hypothetical protein